MPDGMLLVAVAAGIAGGPGRGAVVGFLAGMTVDVFLSTPLGLSALVFSLVGYGVGTAQTGILRSAWWIPVATAFVASAAGEVLFAVAGAVVGEPHLVNVHLLLVALLVGVENAALAPLAVRIVGWAVARPSSGAYVV
jgi:rod shape-determining protein MreD